MTANELFEIIAEHYNDNIEEIAIETNDLIGRIGQCTFTYELSEILTDYTLSMDKCPLCGKDLKVLSHHEENRGEYQGIPCNETMYLIGCEDDNCSYILNK